MARRSTDPVAAPRVRVAVLPELAPCDAERLADADADLDGVEVADVRLEFLDFGGRRRLDSSSLSGLEVTTWTARGSSISDSILDHVDVRELSAPESGWRGVTVRHSRVGSAELFTAQLRSVHFAHCRLGYVNLRGSRLVDVSFSDCVIDDLDLLQVTATRVAFAGSRIGRIDLAGSTLDSFDLRGAHLVDIGSVDGLRGATITLDQLLSLAPAMAERLGVRIG